MATFSELANPWVRGLGVYEPGRPIEEVARELGFKKIDDVIKLASNENALGPSPRALRAMRQAAGRMHLYPDGSAFYLKQALARRLGVPAAQLVITNGSNEALEFLGHVFLGPDTDIVMADRAFVVYRLIAAMCRARVIAVPMRDYTHDLDAMLAAITPQTRIVFIANPNNPTSTMVDGRAIERFMANVPDHVIVCFDEAYIELLPETKQPRTLRYARAGRKVVILRTFSKTYGLAGLRVGYVVAPRECVLLMERVRQPFNVNAMALAAATEAIADDAYVQRTRKMVTAGLEQLGQGFRKMGLPFVPAVANFILVDVSRVYQRMEEKGQSGVVGRAVFEALQRLGIIVRPMDGYGLPDHVRITVGTRAENRKCLTAMQELMAG